MTQHMIENKYDADESDDDHQEVVVNGSDYREQIYEFESHRDLSIIKCIGQIKSEYSYQIEHEYKTNGVGTGTVYTVTGNGAHATAFVLTCAHNLRHKIYKCNSCKTYNRKNNCSKCGKTLTPKDKKLLQPTVIEFKRRTTTKHNFGRTEKSYKCYEVYVPDAYEQNIILAKGFDFAILMFVDDDKYYSKHCGNMQLGLGAKIL
eukprot:341111_1